MVHKSFYEEYEKIAAEEIKELRRCLEKHGGSFSWKDRNIDYPIITVALNCSGWVGDMNVEKIWINEFGSIRLFGKAKEDGFETEFRLDEIHYSHIDFIMDYLPEP